MKGFDLLILFSALVLSSQIFADATTTTSVTTTAPAGTTVVTTPETAPAPTTVITDKDAMMAAIVSDVQAKISQDPTFSGTDIAVSSQSGVTIVLNGTVDTQAQVDAAISTAKAVPGVADVISNLTIRTPSTMVIAPAPVPAATSTTTTTTSTTAPAP